MTSEEKPGWLGRLWGRRKDEVPPSDQPAQPDPGNSASQSEGRPDFATGAAEVRHVPVPASEPSRDEPEKNSVPDEIEGADLQPIEPLASSSALPDDSALPAAASGPSIPAPNAPEAKRSWWKWQEASPPPASDPSPDEAVKAATAGVAPVVDPAAAPVPAANLGQEVAPPDAPEAKRNWWNRLTSGMRRTSSQLSDRVTGLFTKRKLDATTLEELEDALIQADFGLEVAMRISEAVGKGRYEKGISPDEVRAILATEVEQALAPVAKPLAVDATKKPFVILMTGVNGAGKTTTIGKLALKLKAEGRSVMLAAGDTFRAAAIEQLRVWGERTGTPVISREQGADAAGLAFDALKEAKAKGVDVLLIDTAGRLQNKTGLMAELEKIVRVLRKLDPDAPHAGLLVLDATVGQNALSQVELFSQAAPISGLVMTKLDGTARGGILVALAAKFGLPVHYIGVGEGVDDLEPFAARDFARAIAGLERD